MFCLVIELQRYWSRKTVNANYCKIFEASRCASWRRRIEEILSLSENGVGWLPMNGKMKGDYSSLSLERKE